MFKAPILLLALAGVLTACGGSDLAAGSTDPSADRPPADAPSSDTPPADDQQGLPVDGSVLLQWSRPSQRENGDYLEGDEIGGYELRYRELESEEPQVVQIDDSWIESYQIEHLEGAYDFAIAVYDRDGLYSEFVPLQPY